MGRHGRPPEMEHLAEVPTWLCRQCARDWPCSPARLRLREEYRNDRVALGVYMAQCMIAAERDLIRINHRQPDAGDLYVRFILWTASAFLGPVRGDP